MKPSNATKLFWGSAIALSTAILAPLPASAQTAAPTQPGTAETTIPDTTAPTTVTPDTTTASDGDGFDWDWLGLLGLIGLAGLAGRKSPDRSYDRPDATIDPNISTTRPDYRR
jgi:hypothetical protein